MICTGLLARYQRQVEFSVYLKTHNLKLVNSDYQVAGDEATVVSRVEYENKQREKDILLERVQELRAKIEWLAKERNILE